MAVIRMKFPSKNWSKISRHLYSRTCFCLVGFYSYSHWCFQFPLQIHVMLRKTATNYLLPFSRISRSWSWVWFWRLICETENWEYLLIYASRVQCLEGESTDSIAYLKSILMEQYLWFCHDSVISLCRAKLEISLMKSSFSSFFKDALR